MLDSTELKNRLADVMDQITLANDHQEINGIVEKLLIELIDSDRATLMLFDRAHMELSNHTSEMSQKIYVVGSAGLLGLAILQKKSAIYSHLTSEKHYDPTIDNPYDMKLKGQIIYPLTAANDRVVGIVRLSRSIRFNLNYIKSDLEILKSLEEFLINVVEVLQKKAIKSTELDQGEVAEKITKLEQEHKNVEKQLKNDNDAINANMLFLSNTVHDIRTPANSLYGFLELMEGRVKDERLLEYISHAKESAQFINTLTDSILEQVKHEKESAESKPTTINSIKFFSGIANIFTANMLKKEIDYLIYIDPSIPKEIEIEELKLKRILINLIGNAYKFTPKDKAIKFAIEYDKLKKSLHFSVKDTGIGIAAENKESIFQSFQQAEDDTALHFGGTGLGLAISAKYVKELGGKLELDSELGVGSNFYFTIPSKVIDKTDSYLPLVDTAKYITILTDVPSSINAENIKKYLESLSIPPENIKISNQLEENTTHLFCFEHKLNEEIISICKEKRIMLIAVEKELFSISQNSQYEDISIISENSYYGDTIYSVLLSKRKPRVMIADDNKINVMLLKTILESEDCEIVYSLDGQEVFDKLVEGIETNNSYDVIFADKHMPTLSGSEVIEKYKAVESKYHSQKPIITISITGDPTLHDTESKLYDMIVSKPFDKTKIQKAFHKAIEA